MLASKGQQEQSARQRRSGKGNETPPFAQRTKTNARATAFADHPGGEVETSPGAKAARIPEVPAA